MITPLGFIDISANLHDPMFQGMYNGTKEHEPDLPYVLKRSWDQRVKKIIIKGNNRSSSMEALALAKTDKKLFCTIGCSPLHVKEFDEQGRAVYYNALKEMCFKNRRKVVAIGECGLDFDKLHIVDAVTQMKFFRLQLGLAHELDLPLLIRYRNAGHDLIRLLKPYSDDLVGAVIHGFQGTEEEAKALMRMGCHIGLSGCSFISKDVRETIKDIPTQRIMLGSDAPHCWINPGQNFSPNYVKTMFPSEKVKNWSPEKRVKGRNEPGNIVQVLEVAAAIRNENPDLLAYMAYRNSKNFFLSPTRRFIN